MNIASQGERLILSNPISMAEKRFMEKIAAIARATGSSTIEFRVDTTSMNDNVTHVGLEPVIPEVFCNTDH